MRKTVNPKAKRRSNYKHFFSSVLIAVVLPLLPILIEGFIFGDLKSVYIATIVFVITTLTTSSSVLQFSIGIVCAVFLAIIVANIDRIDAAYLAPCLLIIILLTSILHIGERFNLHVRSKQKFINLD